MTITLYFGKKDIEKAVLAYAESLGYKGKSVLLTYTPGDRPFDPADFAASVIEAEKVTK